MPGEFHRQRAWWATFPPGTALACGSSSHWHVESKEPPANAGDSRDTGSILGLGRSPGGGNGNLLQYSYQENPLDRGSWWTIVCGVAKSQIQLSDKAHTKTYLKRQKTILQKLQNTVKGTEDDTHRWKGILYHWMEESILSKWLYYPRQSTESMQSLSKYQWHFFK